MAYYVGDTVSGIFSTGVAGETFTRTASYIAGAGIVWSPTFTDLGGGAYRYSYVTTTAGIHEWLGSGSATGTLSIDFDVDAAAAGSTTTTTRVVTTAASATGFPTIDDLIVYQGIDQVESWRIMVEDDAGAEVLADTDGWLARITIRRDAEAATELLCSTGNGRMQVGYDPPEWDNATAYALGQEVVPTALNGHVYRVTTAGTSGGSEPTWPTGSGLTVADNSVVWTEVGSDDDVSNLRLVLTPTDTDPLTDWGYGVWALKVWVDGTIETLVSQGNAVLNRDIARS